MLRLEGLANADAGPQDTGRAGRPEHTVFQSAEWLEFLAETQGCRPVVAAVVDGATRVGWFTGALVRRYGVPILGSPFPGWSTSYLGFDLDPGVDRGEAAAALARFAFGTMRCWHVEVLDRHLRADQARAAGYAADDGSALHGWELDLNPTAEELFGGLSSSARWGVRKAARNGVVVQAVDLSSDPDRSTLAEDYQAQLVEVFVRRGRSIPYGRDRVDALLRHVGGAGHVVGLRASGPDGSAIATGIFPFDQRRTYFWGGASTALGRELLANDALLWHAITVARDRGCSAFDFGGGGSFKAKFGGQPISVPWARRSRWAVVEHARTGAATAVGWARRRPVRRRSAAC